MECIIHHIISYSDFCLYWYLACICDGIFAFWSCTASEPAQAHGLPGRDLPLSSLIFSTLSLLSFLSFTLNARVHRVFGVHEAYGVFHNFRRVLLILRVCFPAQAGVCCIFGNSCSCISVDLYLYWWNDCIRVTNACNNLVDHLYLFILLFILDLLWIWPILHDRSSFSPAFGLSLWSILQFSDLNPLSFSNSFARRRA